MRFFSNEAKETDDDQEVAESERSHAQVDGASVPQQRSGSPWSDTPGTVSDPVEPNASDSLQNDSLQNDSLKTDDSEVRHDGDDLVRDDDAPHSDKHDDLDLPLDGQATGTDEHEAGSHRADADGETTDTTVDTVDAGPGAEQHDGTTTTYGPDGSVTTVDDPAATSVDTAEDTPVHSSVDAPVASSVGAPADSSVDAPADSSVGAPEDTPVDAPVDTVADTSVGTSVGSNEETKPVAVDSDNDERDLDEASPVLATAPVETADDTEAIADPTPVEDTATDADAAPAVAAVPATPEAAKPDPTANPVGDKLFTDSDSFTERLRDITFNFVDNPQEATQQAAGLVDEAIDKVTSALKAQKDALASEGSDTEKLRVELRGYRDILQRLTAL